MSLCAEASPRPGAVGTPSPSQGRISCPPSLAWGTRPCLTWDSSKSSASTCSDKEPSLQPCHHGHRAYAPVAVLRGRLTRAVATSAQTSQLMLPRTHSGISERCAAHRSQLSPGSPPLTPGRRGLRVNGDSHHGSPAQLATYLGPWA